MSWQELRRAEKNREELLKFEKSWDKPRWDEKKWEEMRKAQVTWEAMRTVVISWEELRKGEKTWDGIRWWKKAEKKTSDELGWVEVMRWDDTDCGDSGMQWAIPREAAMSEIRWNETRFNSQETWHQIDKSRDCCCAQGRLACHLWSQSLPRSIGYRRFQFETSAPACPGTTGNWQGRWAGVQVGWRIKNCFESRRIFTLEALSNSKCFKVLFVRMLLWQVGHLFQRSAQTCKAWFAAVTSRSWSCHTRATATFAHPCLPCPWKQTPTCHHWGHTQENSGQNQSGPSGLSLWLCLLFIIIHFFFCFYAFYLSHRALRDL